MNWASGQPIALLAISIKLLGRGLGREYGLDGLLDLCSVALGVRGGRRSELSLELVEQFSEGKGHVREADLV